MSEVTHDIMRYLKVDAEKAMQLHAMLLQTDLDFSRCTQREFEQAAVGCLDESMRVA